MNPTKTLDRIEELLEEERASIRAMDAAAVEGFATEKEQLFAELAAASEEERAPLLARIRIVMSALRHNGLLLANARDCVRDALVAAGANLGTAHRPNRIAFIGSRGPNRVSVRG